MAAQLTGTTVLFSDDWSQTGSTPTQLNSSNWDYTHWTAQNNASYLGQTQMIQSLPYAYNGAAHFTVETWLSPGGSFSGQDAFTTQQYNLNTYGGLAFEGKFKLDAPTGGVGTDRLHIPTTPNATSIQGGMIAGFFTYQFFTPGNGQPAHDELDFEALTTETQRVSTNVFTQSSGQDNPSSKPVAPGTFSSDTFNAWHTYRIEWLPTMVKWYMDGSLIRTETNPTFLPNPAINEQLHMDLWGVPAGWVVNPGDPTGPNVGDPSFVPATSAGGNAVYDFQVQSIKIEQISTMTGDSLVNSISGGAGNDAISGQGGDDVLAGGAGDDTIFGGSGNDKIDGGAGDDTAVVVQDSKNVLVKATAGSSTLTVQDKVAAEGTDTLTSIETIQFNDRAIDASSITKAASLSAAQILSVVDLYTAGLGRAPDAVGLDYWAGRLASGASLSDISKAFFSSAEAAAIYGSPSSDQVFVSRAYNTALGHAPDAKGETYWISELQSGHIQRADFVTALIAGARALGANTADAQYIANREAVGGHFALTQGLNDLTWARTVESSVSSSAASVTAANAQTDGFAAIAATGATSQLVVQILGIVP